jgi:hypothetical protein
MQRGEELRRHYAFSDWMQSGPWFRGLLTVVLTGPAFIASLGKGLSKASSSSFGLGV